MARHLNNNSASAEVVLLRRGMKILLAAGAALLIVAALLPFRALASSPATGTRTMAFAISQPLAGLVAGSLPRFPVAEPGLLLVVGSGLIGLGSLMRRITSEPPPSGQ